MHEQQEPTNKLHDLNQVLVEYGVFYDSMEERRALLQPMVTAGTTETELREVCAWIRKSNKAINNLGAKIAKAIKADPKLQAALVAARARTKWNAPKAAPGERDQVENMERELQNSLGVESRMAMRAHCSLKYREATNVEDLAAQMGITTEKAQQLADAGAVIYSRG